MKLFKIFTLAVAYMIGSFSANAQSNGNFSKVTIRDSVWMNGKWVKDFTLGNPATDNAGYVTLKQLSDSLSSITTGGNISNSDLTLTGNRTLTGNNSNTLLYKFYGADGVESTTSWSSNIDMMSEYGSISSGITIEPSSVWFRAGNAATFEELTARLTGSHFIIGNEFTPKFRASTEYQGIYFSDYTDFDNDKYLGTDGSGKLELKSFPAPSTGITVGYRDINTSYIVGAHDYTIRDITDLGAGGESTITLPDAATNKGRMLFLINAGEWSTIVMPGFFGPNYAESSKYTQIPFGSTPRNRVILQSDGIRWIILQAPDVTY